MLMFEQSLNGVEEDVFAVPAVSLGRRIGVSLFGIVLIGFISQLAIQGWFNGKIVAGVTVGHIDVGGLDLAEARTRLNTAESSRTVSFVIAGKRYQPSLVDIGARYDTERVLKNAYLQGRGGIATHPQTIDLALSPEVDQTKLASYLAPITHIGTAPVDARLEVHKGVIAVIPDKPGFSINASGLEKVLRNNLSTFGAEEPVIASEVLGASIQIADLNEAQTQAKALMATPIILTDGATQVPVASTDIATWLSFAVNDATKKTVATIDPNKVSLFVSALAKRLDHAPVDRRVNNVNGISTTQVEGKDGDAIDQAPITDALSKLIAGTPIALAISRHPVAFKTSTLFLADISSGRYIEINLNLQHLWVWDNHIVVYESPITSGAVGVGLGTVTGTFNIYAKETNRRLIGPGYDVPVKWWMPFHLGYGLHDAIWRQGKFGGQDYIRGGSHGCVNLPDATAEWIYNWADIGTAVYIHK